MQPVAILSQIKMTPEIKRQKHRPEEEFIITLPANPTTGYNWNIDYDYALLSLQSSDYIASSSKAWAPRGISLCLRALRLGRTTIYLSINGLENIVADTNHSR